MAKKKNYTGWYILGGVALVVLILISWYVSSFNGLVVADETVNEKWGNVQTAYQRRADLIPNLVATVQGAADFESETQTQIAAVRSSAVAAQNAVKSAQTPEQLASASTQVEGAITDFGGLNINVERYPELRAVESFLSLQDELAGTENRVKVERDNYNKAVKEFNIRVRRFPTSVVAGMNGFDKKVSFEADDGTENVPVVGFT